MSKKLLKNGEMIAISSNWIAADSEQHQLIMKYPHSAGVIGAAEKAHAAMLAIEHPTPSPALAQLRAAEESMDGRHDASVKGIDAALTAAEFLTQNAELSAAIRELHQVLLPAGVSIVKNSYLDEVGKARAVRV